MTKAAHVKVNRAKDWVERVGWTAVQAAGGAGLDVVTSGHLTWRAVGYAAAIAAVKVVLAQNLGRHPDGAAIPGGISDPPS